MGIIAVLIIASAAKQQYSYYTFVQWAVPGTSFYFAYKAYNREQIGFLIYFSLVAIIFNPFNPFWFQKETWHLIDYIVSTITFMTIYSDWTKHDTEQK